jgi:hypothetical protein
MKCSQNGYSSGIHGMGYEMMAVPKRKMSMKRKTKTRSQYAKKKTATMKRKTKSHSKTKTRSLHAKKVRKIRKDKGVKRGPRKSMTM